MEHIQMTFDELLSYLDQNRAAQESRPRSFILAASSHAEGNGFYSFGSYRDTISLDGFTPGTAYLLDHYPVLRYYLDHHYLDSAAIIDIYAGELDEAGEQIHRKPDAHFTMRAADLYAAM